MASRGKRVRREGGSSSNPPESMADSPDSSPPPVLARPPWPRREGMKIISGYDWDDSPKKVAESDACVYREFSEHWDEFDTLFYNAWLGVKIKPTRVADSCALRRMGIKDDVVRMIEGIGLGSMATTHHDLFPELVRQFLSTVRVYYTNEILRTAQEGTITFFIRGVRYRLSIPELCAIYGFDADRTGVALPVQFMDAGDFWSHFATGRYDSKTSTQTDIRHPVLRYVARILSHTLLCKMEPGKMRLSELILLSYGVDRCVADGEWTPVDENVNLGAIFAHHLVSLKMKPFLGRGTKRETVGSLLTPIFRHFGIDTSSCTIDTSRCAMDSHYLKNAQWIKGEWIWCFRSDTRSHMIQLPQVELTALTEPRMLRFEPDRRILHRAPPVRRTRGASSSALPTAAEDAPIPDYAGAAGQPSRPSEIPPFEPLFAPETPMEPAAFQRFVIDSLQRIWETVSRCTCMHPPRRRSVSPRQSGLPPRPAPDASSEED